MKDIKYIYEDNDILVCHKPSGVATEGARTYNMDVVRVEFYSKDENGVKHHFLENYDSRE